MIKLNDMKSIVSKTGTALLVMWIIVVVTILVIGAGSDGPIDSHSLINAWMFYGFILGVPTIAVAMMKWGGAKH